MKIIVAIKQVPVRDSQLRVDASGKWIQEADLSFEINEPDAYALEEALQLKEKHGGEVIALCLGPARAAQTIREALAKGADRAIHIEEENLQALDTLGVAKLLAAAAKNENPDLFLTGLQSDDLGYGQTGVVAAELLGLPHSTIIMSVEVEGSKIRVKRELEDGWFQHIEMPLPAVLTIQSGINKLRYATLMGIKKAKTKEIKRVTSVELGAAPAANAVIEKIYLPQKTKQAQIFEGDAKSAAAKLVEKLKFEVRLIRAWRTQSCVLCRDSSRHMMSGIRASAGVPTRHAGVRAPQSEEEYECTRGFRAAGREVAPDVVGNAGGGSADRLGHGIAGGGRGRGIGDWRAGARSGNEESRQSLRGRS